MRKVLLIFLILTFACSDDKIKPSIDNSDEYDEIPTQESWNSKILFTEDGNLKAVLYADHLTRFSEKEESYLDQVRIDFFDGDGLNTSKLTSKKGRVDDATKNMFAIDSVVAVSDSGVTLLTDELMWNNKTQKITTDKFVTIISTDEKIQGYGFESDQSLSNYVIYKVTYITDLKDEKAE